MYGTIEQQYASNMICNEHSCNREANETQFSGKMWTDSTEFGIVGKDAYDFQQWSMTPVDLCRTVEEQFHCSQIFALSDGVVRTGPFKIVYKI
jgi:hypothetical protein